MSYKKVFLSWERNTLHFKMSSKPFMYEQIILIPDFFYSEYCFTVFSGLIPWDMFHQNIDTFIKYLCSNNYGYSMSLLLKKFWRYFSQRLD